MPAEIRRGILHTLGGEIPVGAIPPEVMHMILRGWSVSAFEKHHATQGYRRASVRVAGEYAASVIHAHGHSDRTAKVADHGPPYRTIRVERFNSCSELDIAPLTWATLAASAPIQPL
jgi:hypothetical protein